MKYTLEFEILGLPKMPNQLLGRHWRARSSHAQKWTKLVMFIVVRKVPKKPLEKAKLILTRYSSREPDYDGLTGSFKAVVDALKKTGIIADDTLTVIGKSEYRWEKVSPREGKIRIRVEEI